MTTLTDRFGRVHDYLRVSLTDRCNLRCTYCMPETPCFMAPGRLMSTGELLEIAGTFVHELGVKKIRFTGGEPLVRKDAAEVFRAASFLPAELAITTNGVLLDRFLPLFDRIGLRSVNVSLDSMDAGTFRAITRRNRLHSVRNNIRTAADMGFNVKVNVVVLREINEDEIAAFVDLTRKDPLHVRFIEFMPFSGNRWERPRVVTGAEVLERLKQAYEIEKACDEAHSTSKAYRVKGFRGTFATISSVSEPFCSTCNRLRLTADGKLRNCLFGAQEWDLPGRLRSGRPIVPLIRTALEAKAAMCGGLPVFTDPRIRERVPDRCMTGIGG